MSQDRDYLTEAIEAGTNAVDALLDRWLISVSSGPKPLAEVAVHVAAPIIERAVREEREIASKEVMHALLGALREFRDAIAPPPAPDHEVQSWPLCTPEHDLHTRLVAALQARLEVARALGGETWYPAFYSSMDEWRVRDRRTQEPRAEVVDDDDAERRAQFIAANDPATEIRRVEALLRVVELHAPDPWVRDLTYCHCCSDKRGDSMEDWPCDTIRDLAAGEGIE